jgi:hypothetical protein
MTDFIAALFSDPTTNLVIALVIVLPLVDWATGSLRAVANGTFTLSAFDVFVRTQIAGRTLPLTILMLLGRALTVAVPQEPSIPGLDLGLLTAAGIAASVPYVMVAVQSILANVTPSAPDSVPTVTEGGSA